MIPYNYATRDLRRALRPKGQQCWQVQKTWSPVVLHLDETSSYISARFLQFRQSIRLEGVNAVSRTRRWWRPGTIWPFVIWV